MILVAVSISVINTSTLCCWIHCQCLYLWIFGTMCRIIDIIVQIESLIGFLTDFCWTLFLNLWLSASYAVTLSKASSWCCLEDSIYTRSLLRAVAFFFLPMHREQTLPKVTAVIQLVSNFSSSHLALLRDFQLPFHSQSLLYDQLKEV